MERDALLQLYRHTRATSAALCEPLATEDYVVQTMPDVSPAKWHLGHTTWFFETFVVGAAHAPPPPVCEAYAVLFNSYYQGVGPQHPRRERGLLSRPTVAEVYEYRRIVDERVEAILRTASDSVVATLEPSITIGIAHEEQHQELLVTDFKHVLCTNPLHPAYRSVAPRDGISGDSAPTTWRAVEGGVTELGFAGDGFAFDNERPRHKSFVPPFELSERLVTNGEYLEFIGDGGYGQPDLWLAEGWDVVRHGGWEAPLYWERRDELWHVASLTGLSPVALDEPVCHVSYYEADAYARWAGARLPREDQWELAAIGAIDRAGGLERLTSTGNFLETRLLHPAPAAPARDAAHPAQLFGDVWEWTASSYEPYPGFSPFAGALGEYNGKFMVNQLVLRGGSCATPARHIRATYRNFFPASARWQFMGIRLAR